MFTSPTVRIPYGIYSTLYENDFDALATILITDFISELSDIDESSACHFRSAAEKEPQFGIIHMAFRRELPESQDPDFARHLQR